MSARLFSTLAEAGLHAYKEFEAQLVKKASFARFYVTYGNCTNLANCYSEIPAPNIEEARKLAFSGTRGKHAFLYSEREWNIDAETTQAERYNLRLVPLQPQKTQRTYYGRTMS